MKTFQFDFNGDSFIIFLSGFSTFARKQITNLQLGHLLGL